MNNVTRGNGLLEDFLANQRAKKASSLIPQKLREGRILDIGCGSYPYFLTNTNFKEKHGLDPSLANLKISNIKLRKMNVTKDKLPFVNNFFNVVTMLAVFEHVDGDKLISLLKEIKRVLKKDGVLIITTPAPWSDKLLHQMGKIGLISSEEIHEHKHNHKKDRIENFIEDSGFKKEKITSGYFELWMNMWFRSEA